MFVLIITINNLYNELNRNFGFNTTETLIGTYAGQNLYRKVISIGALPNATEKLVPHGIADISGIRAMYAVAVSSSAVVSIPFLVTANLGYGIEIQIVGSNIKIYTGSQNLSSSTGYVTIEYVK